jgi:hypothetical protein
MAKTTSQPIKDTQTKEIPLTEIFKNANVVDSPDIYANHAQFTITVNEIIIDLYKIFPDHKSKIGVSSERLQRVFIPHSLGKGFVEGLANAIQNYQDDTGNQLVNNREKTENDKIKVW